MDELIQLKAQAYDLIAEVESAQFRLNDINRKISALIEQIKKPVPEKIQE